MRSARVRFADGTSSLGVEALAFQIAVAYRALEALGVIVIVEGFDPAVASFYREPTANTLGREQFVPVFLTIR